MSAIRISRPGYPTVFIDLGPSEAKTNRVGGSLVVGSNSAPVIMPSTTPSRRAQMAVYRAKRAAPPVKPKCGRLMPMVKEYCGRGAGHRDSCRSPIVIAEERARRRTAHPRGGTHPVGIGS